uniref:atrial natriuretic peptide receptor 3-like isoform X1 n=1 Tax=Styela clava TaxID=7725 RepID=UPI00193A9FED|nr:atrial natriuretic peptide receptor 3-like isoform X1 [Styela clava]
MTTVFNYMILHAILHFQILDTSPKMNIHILWRVVALFVCLIYKTVHSDNGNVVIQGQIKSRLNRFHKIFKRGVEPTFGSLTTIKLAVILPTRDPFLFQKGLVQPAIDYAVNSVKNDMAAIGYKLEPVYRDSFCSRRAALAVVDLYYDDDAMYNRSLSMPDGKNIGVGGFVTTQGYKKDAKRRKRSPGNMRGRDRNSPLVFLGPVCNEATSIVSAFAENWNVPLITSGAPAAWITPGPDYPTLIRVSPSYLYLAYFISILFNNLGYGTKVPIHLLYEDVIQGIAAERECHYVMQAVYHVLNRDPYMRLYGPTYITSGDFDDERIASDMGDPRVVLMCASSDVVRRVMLGAYKTGFANPRRNMWYTIDLRNTEHYANGAWKRGDDQDEIAKLAYRALQVITIYTNNAPRFKNFVKKMNKEYEKSGIQHSGTVNEFVEGFHDAVLLYAHAVRQCHERGINIRDGRAISRFMKNVTIHGIAGPVVMTENGDRHGDYSILAMKDYKLGTFSSVYDYLGSWVLVYNHGMPELDLTDEAFMNYSQYNNGVDVKAILAEAEREKATRPATSTTQHEILAGILGTFGGMILCFVLIFGPMCYNRRRRPRMPTSENGNAVGNFLNGNSDQICLHRPLREEGSVTTCTTTLDDDQKL